jgi:hypothetical protein
VRIKKSPAYNTAKTKSGMRMSLINGALRCRYARVFIANYATLEEAKIGHKETVARFS